MKSSIEWALSWRLWCPIRQHCFLLLLVMASYPSSAVASGGGGKNRHNARRKRTHHHHSSVEDDEEPTMDDLAVAAQYANPTLLLGVATEETAIANQYQDDNDDGDENEIHFTDEDEVDAKEIEENNKSQDVKETNPEDPEENLPTETDEEEKKIEEDDDDDDESDVDLGEQLAQMVGDEESDDDDEDDGHNKKGKKPLTENEIDLYSPTVTAETLEQLSLSQTGEQETTAILRSDDFRVAGHVQHYLVTDGIITAQSHCENQGQGGILRPGNVLLEEGTLVFWKPPSTLTTTASASEKEGKVDPMKIGDVNEFHALGTILEVRANEYLVLRFAHHSVSQCPPKNVLSYRTLTAQVFGPVQNPIYSIKILRPSLTTPKAKKSTPEKDTEPGDSAAEKEAAGITSVQGSEKETALQDYDGSSSRIKDKEAMPEQAESNGTDKEAIPDATDGKERDSWAVGGPFSTFLREELSKTAANENQRAVPIYYNPNRAKLINTEVVYETSGRGCDASNRYDEEIVNPNQLDYSDDEEERLAKGGRRRKSGGKGGLRRQPGQQQRPHRHGNQPPFHHGGYNPPQGFYHPPAVPAPYPQQYQPYQYPYQQQPQYHNNSIPPPPPPPPPRPGAPATGFYAPPSSMYQPAYQHYQQQQPPPPPPPPPAASHQQQHQGQQPHGQPPPDTVYYDFS